MQCCCRCRYRLRLVRSRQRPKRSDASDSFYTGAAQSTAQIPIPYDRDRNRPASSHNKLAQSFSFRDSPISFFLFFLFRSCSSDYGSVRQSAQSPAGIAIIIIAPAGVFPRLSSHLVSSWCNAVIYLSGL